MEKVQELSPTGDPKDFPHDVMVISGMNDVWGYNNKAKPCAITTVPTADTTAHILRFGHVMEALPNSIIVGFGNGKFWGIDCFDVAVQNITTILRQVYTGPIIGTNDAFRVVAARKGQKGSTMKDGMHFNASSESEQVICNLVYDVTVVMNFIDNVNRVRISQNENNDIDYWMEQHHKLGSGPTSGDLGNCGNAYSVENQTKLRDTTARQVRDRQRRTTCAWEKQDIAQKARMKQQLQVGDIRDPDTLTSAFHRAAYQILPTLGGFLRQRTFTRGNMEPQVREWTDYKMCGLIIGTPEFGTVLGPIRDMVAIQTDDDVSVMAYIPSTIRRDTYAWI
jgi:hypothetical protein